ncbi:MAG: IclR family transcriptional regulator [Lacisediminihabitans sp.]
MTGNTADPGVSVISRTAKLLGSFDGEHPRLTLTEVSARCGLSMTTTHRMLGELVRTKLLARGADQRYSIGRALWELGEVSPLSLNLRETALPYLLTLYEATAENVHLAILDGLEALYVARLVGPHSVPTISRMGGRLPLHTTGVGKTLLAWQDDAFLFSYFARTLERPTKFSIISERRLRAQLAEVRRSGFSETHQEMTLGNTSLAVPVMGRGGIPLAAVGLVTHTVGGDIVRLVPVLQKAAAGLSASLVELMDRDGIETL